MNYPAQATAAVHSSATTLEDSTMNAISSSGLDWRSVTATALSGAAPLWLVVAAILVAATGACPHLYL